MWGKENIYIKICKIVIVELQMKLHHVPSLKKQEELQSRNLT